MPKRTKSKLTRNKIMAESRLLEKACAEAVKLINDTLRKRLQNRFRVKIEI